MSQFDLSRQTPTGTERPTGTEYPPPAQPPPGAPPPPSAQLPPPGEQFQSGAQFPPGGQFPPSAQFPPGVEPPPSPIRRVRRSRQDRVFGGVCGGLGRYLQVDPVLLRIAAVALALSGGLGVLAYVIAWIVIPEETGPEPAPEYRPENRHGVAVVVGASLVALGALFIVRELVPWFSAAYFWPIVVVAVGIVVLTSARR